MADRHNLDPNPALDNDVTGWAGGETPVRTDVTAQSFPRTWAARYSTATFMLGPSGAASAGNAYTISVYVRPDSFAIAGTLAIQWNDGGGNEISETTVSFPSTSAGTVTRVSVTGTAPASTASMRLLCFGENYASNPCNFTALLYEQSGSLDTYFDGNSPSGSWDGASGNSTSTLSSGSAVSGDATQTTTASPTATAVNAAAGAASQTTTASGTAAGANAAAGAATATSTASGTATGANAAAGTASASTAAAPTATGVNAAAGAATATTTASATADATVTSLGASATITAVAIATATVTRAATGGSWYSLLDITREAAAIAQAERSRAPVACPNDGEPLQSHRGILHCPFDGFTWEG